MRTPRLVVALLIALGSSCYGVPHTEIEMAEYLAGEYETQASLMCNKMNLATWDFNVDLSNSDKLDHLDMFSQRTEFDRKSWEMWFRDADSKTYQNEATRRQVEILSNLGIAALPVVDLKQYNMEVSTMEGVYGSARVCPYQNQQCDIETEGMALEPDVEAVMAHSRDYDELEYMWNEWRAKTGAIIRNSFTDYVRLSNDAATLNGYKDLGEMWRSEYEMPDLENDVQRLWAQIQPLYSRLHSYTKQKLQEIYPQMPEGPYIPAHILGDMWAQRWAHLYDVLMPFPEAKTVNITRSMLEQGYDVPKMFAVTNEFFRSLGLESMEMAYGDLAVTEEPSNRDMICHASAWDFCDSKDFRISMCAEVSEEDLATIHHELGHIQYYIQYKDQPVTFRGSANPGFHEAMGDVIALSASTPQHYETIGLLTGYSESYDNTVNTLFRSALNKVVFLPYALALETWRWEVFSGAIPESKWNQRWWDLRREYQLVDSPNQRTETDFDPGAKYHVAANSHYINYFISEILQFQIHRALCIEAGQYDPHDPTKKPLHTCDIYRSIAAGNKLKEAMKVGASEHWSEVLRKLIGETELNAQPMLEYYAPLEEYLSRSYQIEPLADAEPTTPDPDVSQTVPIVVGVILGTVVICTLVFYFVKQHKDKKKEMLAEALEEHREEP